MTRNSDFLFDCNHEPSIPVSDDDGEIIEWRCECGDVGVSPTMFDALSDRPNKRAGADHVARSRGKIVR